MSHQQNFPDTFPLEQQIWEQVAKKLDLPPQQIRLVQLILMRFQDSEIAAEMDIAISTVRTYLNRIFQRTETKDRIDLVITVFMTALEVQANQTTDH